MNKRMSWLVGVDEAGRGALAGPVAVGVVAVPVDFDFSALSVVRDSKQMSSQARERTYQEMGALVAAGAARFHVAMVSAAVIDRVGISAAVERGIRRALPRLGIDPTDTTVLLDGLLSAPIEYLHQETIIRGDVSEPVISLASIMAKVSRDLLMVRSSVRYPAYGFQAHKGYGTKAHRDALCMLDLSPMHRRTFCGRVLHRDA